jgi:hypothetical protein
MEATKQQQLRGSSSEAVKGTDRPPELVNVFG